MTTARPPVDRSIGLLALDSGGGAAKMGGVKGWWVWAQHAPVALFACGTCTNGSSIAAGG